MDKIKGGAKRDKVKAMGAVYFEPGSEPFEAPPAVTATVTYGDDPTDVITVIFPPESFKGNGNSGNYISHMDIGDGSKAKMQIHVNECFWKLRIRGEDTSGLYASDGATIKLDIDQYTGEQYVSLANKKERRMVRTTKFMADPQVSCCDEQLTPPPSPPTGLPIVE